MDELSQQIKSYNASNPVSVTQSELGENYMSKIKHLIAPEGTSAKEALDQGLITQEQANIYKNNFLRQTELKAGIKPSIDPSTSEAVYNIDDLTAMKKQANDLQDPLLSKRANGTSLSGREQVEIAGRDALDQTIINKQPQVKNFTLEQSGLYDAKKPLAKAVNQEYETAQKKPLSFLEKIKSQNPLLSAAEATVAGGGIINAAKSVLPSLEAAGGATLNAVSKIPNQFGYYKEGQSPQAQPDNTNKNIPQYGSNPPSIHTTADLPQTVDKVNINEQLPPPSAITDTTGKPLGIDPQSYKSEKAQIDAH